MSAELMICMWCVIWMSLKYIFVSEIVCCFIGVGELCEVWASLVFPSGFKVSRIANLFFVYAISAKQIPWKFCKKKLCSHIHKHPTGLPHHSLELLIQLRDSSSEEISPRVGLSRCG